MKGSIFISILLLSNLLFAQQEYSTQIGQATIEELQMTTYDKDSSASAVVLYDEVNYYYSNYKKRIYNRDYYSRIKILSNEGLSKGSIKFTIGDGFEILEITGITYNLDSQKGITKTQLNRENVLQNKLNDYFTEFIINFPNVKIGSVLELKFRMSHKEGVNIDDWYFQREIPKVRSRFMKTTPNTMDYIVNLSGTLPLTNKESKENTKCFSKKRSSLKCRFSAYEITDVPAFQREPYMPHESTLISKLNFRFSYFLEPGYRIYKMMTQWSEFDHAMKRYYNDQQLTKKSFFKNIIPDSIYKNGTKLTIARNIFHFIQDHYSWNGYTAGDTHYNIRRTFRNRTASVNLIAQTLYNGLKAAGIECYYVAVSTNNKGPVDWKIPNRSQFNYTVIKAIIDGKSYFLDATDKSIGFGYVQPFANVKDGRVLDYTVIGRDEDTGSEIYKGSYREKMVSLETPSKVITSEWNFSDDKGFYGLTNLKRSGYEALSFRRDVSKIGKAAKQENVQEGFVDYDILEYQIKSLDDRDQSVEEHIAFQLVEEEWEDIKENTSFDFCPIQAHIFSKNPFESNSREHPVDFLFSRNLKYRYTFNIPKGYDVIGLPKNTRLLFPNNGGSYLYRIAKAQGKLRIFINLKISTPYYEPHQYGELKKLFEEIFKLENTALRLIKI